MKLTDKQKTQEILKRLTLCCIDQKVICIPEMPYSTGYSNHNSYRREERRRILSNLRGKAY